MILPRLHRREEVALLLVALLLPALPAAGCSKSPVIVRGAPHLNGWKSAERQRDQENP